MDNVILIGYSGHAFVVADILFQQGCAILGYMESAPKGNNPFDLPYLGDESNEETSGVLNTNNFIVAIGDNRLRRKVYTYLKGQSFNSFNAIHPKAAIASKVSLAEGITVMAGALINPMALIGNGVIINTGAIVEHGCKLDDFVHIAPGATIAGNVSIGKNTFIGANATIKEGMVIGENVLVGAGSVIVRNIPDNAIVYGNPGRRKI